MLYFIHNENVFINLFLPWQKSFYAKDIIIADRDLVEQGSDSILENADSQDVALLVVGDPYGATTHTDLVLRARQMNIPTQVIHNASIMNAVGCTGLQVSMSPTQPSILAYHYTKIVQNPISLMWTQVTIK